MDSSGSLSPSASQEIGQPVRQPNSLRAIEDLMFIELLVLEIWIPPSLNDLMESTIQYSNRQRQKVEDF